MGFGLFGDGGVSKTRSQLTNFQNMMGMQAGMMQQQAANLEAQDLQDQAIMAIRQSEEEAGLMQFQVEVAAGQQMQGYASAGVQQQGTPLQMVNTTRAIGAIQVAAIRERGKLQGQLLMNRSFIMQNKGLQALMGAQGQSIINSGQNQLENQIAAKQRADGWMNFGIKAGSSLLSSLFS